MSEQPTLGDIPGFTSGKGQIDALERYYTPDELAAFVVGLLPWAGYLRTLEPHAGGGAFLRAIEGHGINPWSLDIDPQSRAVSQYGAQVGDFLDESPDSRAPLVDLHFDRVIGNPPFSNGEAHIERALSIADEVAFLLPLSRLETPKRGRFYRSKPLRKVWILGERVWPGSRAIAFFWFVRGWQRPAEIDFVSWKGAEGLEPRWPSPTS